MFLLTNEIHKYMFFIKPMVSALNRFFDASIWKYIYTETGSGKINIQNTIQYHATYQSLQEKAKTKISFRELGKCHF